jgi:hypothetical protein
LEKDFAAVKEKTERIDQGRKKFIERLMQKT